MIGYGSAQYGDFVRLIEPVARHLLGAPNEAQSTRRDMRFGNRGSLSINLEKATWHDHETNEGGGFLDLIERYTACKGPAACFDWLKREGFALDRSNGKANGHSEKIIEQIYPYLDEAGALLFEVVRFHPKDFRQRAPDGRGGYTWSVKGVRQVPYRLPELAEAIANDHAVFVVEGEKDADNLWALGIPATCNAGGAGKWRPELNGHFAGANVVIIPDNDPPKKHPQTGEIMRHPNGRQILPGQDHAAQVADALSGIAARVRVLNLACFWTSMPQKADVSDWLRNGGNAITLHELAEHVPDWMVGDVIAVPIVPQFPLKPFEAITVSLEPNYRIKGVFPRIGLAVVWGPPKCGKSFWTFDAIMHVALGWPYRGLRVQQGTVVYCALEGGAGFASRVEAWRKRHLTDYTGGQIPFYLLDIPLDLVANQKQLVESIQVQLAQSPAIIVIDTLNRALVGDENKSDDMAKLIRAADLLRVHFGCLVILVHHCGIAGNRPRGHTSLAAADDVQIAITRDESGNISAKLEWMKDADTAVPMGAKLERVTVATDTDGDEITSCVIVPAEISKQGQQKRNLSDGAKLALAQLTEALAEVGNIHSGNSHIPAGHPACTVEQWRECYYASHPADNRDTKKKAFLRAVLTLQERGIIGLWSDKVWLSGHGTSPGQNRDMSDSE
jgi:AAA domain